MTAPPKLAPWHVTLADTSSDMGWHYVKVC